MDSLKKMAFSNATEEEPQSNWKVLLLTAHFKTWHFCSRSISANAIQRSWIRFDWVQLEPSKNANFNSEVDDGIVQLWTITSTRKWNWSHPVLIGIVLHEISITTIFGYKNFMLKNCLNFFAIFPEIIGLYVPGLWLQKLSM